MPGKPNYDFSEPYQTSVTQLSFLLHDLVKFFFLIYISLNLLNFKMPYLHASRNDELAAAGLLINKKVLVQCIWDFIFSFVQLGVCFSGDSICHRLGLLLCIVLILAINYVFLS